MIYLDYKEIGQNIRAERKKHKWNQTKLGTKSGVSQRIISFYEKGEIKPRLEELLNISFALGITLDKLVKIHYEGEAK